MIIISLVCSKGGVGKTTTAAALAAYLHVKKKKNVLMLDVDSQASLSKHVGVNTPDITLDEIILQDRTPKKAIVKTSCGDIIPAGIGLAGIDLVIGANSNALETIINDVGGNYDYIIIDTPPSFSCLSVAAITLSQAVIIPVTPQYLSLEGLQQILSNWDAKNLLGVLPTMVDRRKRVTNEVLALYKKHLGGMLYKAEIRQNVKLEEAPSHGKSIFEYAPRSTGAKCYEDFAKETLRRINRCQN